MSDPILETVLLVAEEEDRGLADVSAQLINAALKLRSCRPYKIAAVLPANSQDKTTQAISRLGPEVIYLLDHPLMEKYPFEIVSEGLIQLIKRIRPRFLLLGGTEWGTDMAVRTSAKLGTGLLSEIIDLEVDQEDGGIIGVYMGFENQLICKGRFSDSSPGIATIKPGAFPQAVMGDEKGRVEIFKPVLDSTGFKIMTTRILPRPPAPPELESAEVVIAGGRGVGSKEGFAILKELAQLLGGAVGCSLPPVEKEWMDRDLMIGSTGKMVRPRLYIGCGIYGDVYHTAGMEESEKIVVINDDEKAPFFQLSTCGLVGDLHEILPRIIKMIRKELGEMPW